MGEALSLGSFPVPSATVHWERKKERESEYVSERERVFDAVE